ncbi:MAG: hypothetical protein ACSHXB_04220 [Sulfitobacter sp.]
MENRETGFTLNPDRIMVAWPYTPLFLHVPKGVGLLAGVATGSGYRVTRLTGYCAGGLAFSHLRNIV